MALKHNLGLSCLTLYSVLVNKPSLHFQVRTAIECAKMVKEYLDRQIKDSSYDVFYFLLLRKQAVH